MRYLPSTCRHQRHVQKHTELLRDVAANARVHPSLAIAKGLTAGGSEDALVPDAGMDVKTTAAVAPQRDDVLELDSGKAEGFQRERVLKSAALTPEQRATLEARGYLSPDELHRLASKTRGRMGGSVGEKANCHSDVADEPEAQRLQGDLVQLGRKPAARASS